MLKQYVDSNSQPLPISAVARILFLRNQTMDKSDQRTGRRKKCYRRQQQSADSAVDTHSRSWRSVAA